MISREKIHGHFHACIDIQHSELRGFGRLRNSVTATSDSKSPQIDLKRANRTWSLPARIKAPPDRLTVDTTLRRTFGAILRGVLFLFLSRPIADGGSHHGVIFLWRDTGSLPEFFTANLCSHSRMGYFIDPGKNAGGCFSLLSSSDIAIFY
jgi:hypothetical protein